MGTGRTNRVAPDGSFQPGPERGEMFGNRGRLLGRHGDLVRRFAGTRWIVCVLDFRGREREQWQPGRYTELYFLDEATAFAAGHRPCAECRRPAFEAFRTAWQRAFDLDRPPTAGEMDAVLHRDRLVERAHHRTRHRTHGSSLADLPDGTVVATPDRDRDRDRDPDRDPDRDRDPDLGSGWWLVAGPALREWSAGGYRGSRPRTAVEAPVTVLTPRVTVEVLRAGYRPGVHASAAESSSSGAK